MKIQSTKKSNFPEILPKYVYTNFQICFPKYKFKNSKYIKNVEVYSLRTSALENVRKLEILKKCKSLWNILKLWFSIQIIYRG